MAKGNNWKPKTTGACGFEVKLWPGVVSICGKESGSINSHLAFMSIAIPPFNDSDWFRRDEVCRQFGGPPKGNDNFACLQYFIPCLMPKFTPPVPC